MQNNWKEPRSILMSSVDRVAHIVMGNSCNYCEHTQCASSGAMLEVIKPSNPFTNVCWVSVLINIFCAATNFGCIDSFLLPNSRNEEMMG